MTRGLIASIQRFSLNDGPGIRTTVFFKGCNLHCAWCHNPETITPGQELLFHPERCIGCGHCLQACPAGALTADGAAIRWNPGRCARCGQCAKTCFPGAREMAGRHCTVPEVMREILQDRAYYDDSHGGVTLSGGEFSCQPEFANELIDACHAEGIQVAAETNLCLNFDALRGILEKLDMILFDVKLFDCRQHQEWTGAGNGEILANVRRIDALGMPLVARTPLVPKVTATAQNISAIAGFLKGLGHLRRYELLNFNPLGADKLCALQRENPFRDARPLPEDDLEALRRTAAAFVDTVIG